MVSAAEKGKLDEFAFAAGALTYYIGDACKPLRISYLHHGDPEYLIEYIFKKGEREVRPKSGPTEMGVLSGYEDTMISAFATEVLETR